MSELSHMGYNLFDKVASYNEVTKFVKKKLREVTWEAKQMIMAMNKVENVGKESHQEDLTNDDDLQICLVGDIPILDPPHVRTKGVTNKRIKGLLEKGKEKKNLKVQPLLKFHKLVLWCMVISVLLIQILFSLVL